MKVVYYKKLAYEEVTRKRRKSFRFIVREYLRELETSDIIDCSLSCLHEVHLPLLKEILLKQDLLVAELARPLTKKEKRSTEYLVESYRKSLIHALTSNTEFGYTANVAEWVFFHKEGKL